jgi:hypothetical protein
VSLDYKSENVVNQRHFLSYMLSKFDEDTDKVAENLISNLSKNGADISKIDIGKCVEDIREIMLQSLIKR